MSGFSLKYGDLHCRNELWKPMRYVSLSCIWLWRIAWLLDKMKVGQCYSKHSIQDDVLNFASFCKRYLRSNKWFPLNHRNKHCHNELWKPSCYVSLSCIWLWSIAWLLDKMKVGHSYSKHSIQNDMLNFASYGVK